MAEHASCNYTTQPLIFGEVLYDHFPDGSKVLGGAPFNVAWHLQGFGMAPLLLSRIGDDADGRTVLEYMNSWGMDTRAVQQDAAHPTGTVNITLHNDQPRFHIATEQAYDYIEYAPLQAVLDSNEHSIFYHGTLAARSTGSRGTLHRLLDEQHLPSFVDINLRPPWWQPDEIDWALGGARWVKLNEDELSELFPAATSPHEAARQLAARHHVEMIIVTLGARGALLLQHGEAFTCAAEPITDLIDTVGAGDAFSAVTLLGLTRHWTAERLLKNAVEFAAEICRRRGAIVHEREFYRRFITQWED